MKKVYMIAWYPTGFPERLHFTKSIFSRKSSATSACSYLKSSGDFSDVEHVVIEITLL